MTWIEDTHGAAAAEAQQRQSDRRFMLTIAGIPYQFHDGETAPVQVYDAVSAPDVFYTAVKCFNSVSKLSWRVEDAGTGPGARVRYNPIEVTLLQLDHLEVDVRRLFYRNDRTETTWWAQVITTVDATDPCEVFVDRDPTGLSFPRYFYVGKQVVRATGSAAAGAAWKLTGCTRGAGGTLRRSIKADAISGRTPLITTEPTHFDGRDAMLWYQRYPGDTWRELMPCRVHEEPSVRGDVISMTLNPIANVIDTNLAPDDLATEIISSHHLFQGLGCRVEHIQFIRPGAAFDKPITGNSGAGTGQVISPAGRDEHTLFFDIVSRAGAPGTGHPRNGPILMDPGMVPFEPIQYRTNPPDAFDGFDVPPADPPRALQATVDQVRNASVAEVIQAKVADDAPGVETLVEWPGGLRDAINGAEGWNRVAHTGEFGSWLRITFNLAGPSLNIQRNVPPAEMSVLRYRDVPPQSPEALVWERNAAGDWQSFRPLSLQRLPSRVWSPIVEGGQADTRMRPNDDAQPLDEDVPYPALAFYIPRELKLVTAAALTVPSAAGRLVVRIQQGDTSAEAQILSVANQLDGGGSLVGYACTLDPRHAGQDVLPLFVQGPTDDPITVTPVIRAFDGTSGSLMLQLLLSVEGEGVNGIFDTLITGCAIPEAYVDAASFLSISDPSGIDWRPIFGQGQSVLDFFRIVGLLTSSVVDVVRAADGTAKLTRISLQPTTDPVPLGALGVAQYPSSRGTDVIINAINWTANPDQDGEATWSWSSRDQSSIADHGAKRPLEVFIPGYVPTDAAGRLALLRSLEVRLFERYGRRRKVWQVEAPTDALLRQFALGVVGVTTEKLLNIDGSEGVADEPAQVMKAEIELQGEGGVIEIEPAFIKGTFWNVSALAVGVDGSPWPGTDLVTYPNAETIELDATADGKGDHDAAYFVIGDSVYCAPAGDTDNGITRTVIGVHEANDRITLNDSSGFASPDYGDIWTVPYDTASTVRRERVIPHEGAFFADAAGTLGAAGDDGREVL